MPKLITAILLLAGLFAAQPLLAQKKKGSTKKASTDTRTEAQMRLTNLFMDACKEKMLGNLDDAAARFYDCIKADPTNAAAMYELAGIMLQKGKKEEALLLANRALEINSDNEWYGKLSAEINTSLGKTAQTEKIYRDLVKRHPKNVEFKYELSNALLDQSKLKEAVAVYDQIESAIGVTEEISVQKEKILLQLNDIEGAVRELEKLIAAFPYEVRYLGMLSDIYRANDMPAKAEEIFGRMEKMDPDDPQLNFALADHWRNKKDYERSFQHLLKAFEGPEVDIDRKIQVMLSFFTLSEGQPSMLDKAYKLLDVLERVNGDQAKTFAMKADFLYRDRKLEQARDAFLQTISLDSSRYPIWQGLVNVDFELGDHKSMLNHAAVAVELFPNQGQMHFLHGMALSRNKRCKEALDALSTAELYLRSEPGMLAQTFSAKAECLNELKEFAESDKAFDRALQIDPQNPLFLNNYAYYLSLRNDRLDKAEEMSRRANNNQPNNPSYEDTYAWVLFQKGQFEEALTWIEKALKHGGDKAGVVVEHYGDILYALGKKTEALEQWKKALQLGDGSDALPNKVKNGKPN